VKNHAARFRQRVTCGSPAEGERAVPWLGSAPSETLWPKDSSADVADDRGFSKRANKARLENPRHPRSSADKMKGSLLVVIATGALVLCP